MQNAREFAMGIMRNSKGIFGRALARGATDDDHAGRRPQLPLP